MRKLSHEEIVDRREQLRPAERFPITALLHDIRSLYNVGSMFRTADGANLEALYLSGITGRPPLPGIEKTALGADKVVAWQHAVDPVACVQELKAKEYHILALEHAQGSVPYTSEAIRFPCCLIVGNEITGVPPELMAEADLAIEIPMLGLKNSLNVSVSFAVAIYELVRRMTYATAAAPCT